MIDKVKNVKMVSGHCFVISLSSIEERHQIQEVVTLSSCLPQAIDFEVSECHRQI